MEQCKACGKKITRTRINKSTGSPEELCSTCLAWAMSAAYDQDFNEDPDDLLDDLEIYRE